MQMTPGISFKEAFLYRLRPGFTGMLHWKWPMIPVITGSALTGFLWKMIF